MSAHTIIKTVMVIRRVQEGFTMVELLLGIAVFGIVAPAITLSIVSINGINDKAADLMYANVIAENKIESIRSAGYNSLSDGVVYFTGDLPPTFTSPKSASYTVSSPEIGIKQIDVDITYTDQGKTRNLEFSSMISELGVAQ